jgi:chemotaxis protein histidine kinase CheA
MVKEMILKLKGEIAVRSEENSYTCFTLKIPNHIAKTSYNSSLLGQRLFLN